MLNALSVDVEDWFQVGAFETVIEKASWGGLVHRIERNTEAVMALFEQAGVRATFFTLGWIAARYPALVRRISDAGHEVASHGWDHVRVFRMSPDGFAKDLDQARAAIEDATGRPVTGYRAPNFSIDIRTPWAHEVLANAGYGYSSSIAPVEHDHYGWPDAPRFAFRPLIDSPLIELPVTTVRLHGRNFAAGGGGFFRLFPYGLSRWAINRVNRREQRPAVFYFHPWEIDAGQPRVADAPLASRVRHYVNLDRMASKLQRLLKEFEWTRTDQVAAQQAALLP